MPAGYMCRGGQAVADVHTEHRPHHAICCLQPTQYPTHSAAPCDDDSNTRTAHPSRLLLTAG
jgi:hypothetical protein